MGKVNCSCPDSGFTTFSSAEWCILLGFSDFSNTVTQREPLKVAKSSVCNPVANAVFPYLQQSLLAISRKATKFTVQIIIHFIVKGGFLSTIALE